MPLNEQELKQLAARRKAQWAVGAVVGNFVGVFLAALGAGLEWGGAAATFVAGIGVFVVCVLLGLNN